GTVMNVYTEPAYRKRGYGKKVMDALLQDAKNMQLSYVELKSTEAGYLLYRAVGFEDDVPQYHLMKWYNR
ncbi:MAG: GNAT family N-acetyltransferase, partial [Clostridia bacterium]|nr:GNAT family N-acetyltransferase [Clostridia bacterium]